MEGITGEEIHGCGPSEVSDLRLNVQTTTGGNFSVCVNGQKTVDDVKKLVAKKLKVPKDRICLLHRERQLTEGTLQENGLFDGSRVILLPSVETGLLSQRPENSVMQALENLNDSQVNDFLSGKSPLNLTMRLGDHMMLIQLQLSTLNAAVSGAPGRSRFTSKRSNTPSTSAGTQQREAATRTTPKKADPTKNNSETPKEEASTAGRSSENCSFLRSSELETLTDALKLFKRLAAMKETEKEEIEKAKKESEEELEDDVCSEASTSSANEQSPIKSLSNLVSSPLKSSMQAFNTDENDEKENETMPKYVPLPRSIKNNLVESISNMASNEAVTSQATDTDNDTLVTDPIAANLTSCLCSTLNPGSTCGWKMLSLANSNKPGCSNQSENIGDEDEDISGSPEVEPMECSYDDSRAPNTICYSNRRHPSMPCLHPESTASPDAPCCSTPAHYNRRLSSMLHNTSKFKHPIGQSKPKVFMQSVVKKHMKKRLQESSADTNTSTSSGEPSAIRTRYIHNRKLPLLEQGAPTGSEEISAATQTSPPIAVVTDTKALVEASKNLTQTLKKLSKEVLTTKGGGEGGKEDSVRGKLGPGAVIESMKHHGKGIYSGTFSGTLNPALQDPFGRPKRDISTIIHILNDLLCAGPALTNKDSNATTSSASASTSDSRYTSKTCMRTTCTINHCDGRCVLPCLCTGSNTDKTCLCNMEPPKCSACQDSPDDMQCTKCHKAKELAIDNSKTKGKLDRLRLVMQQKKQRREARKSKPYTTGVNTQMAPPENVKEEIDSVA